MDKYQCRRYMERTVAHVSVTIGWPHCNAGQGTERGAPWATHLPLYFRTCFLLPRTGGKTRRIYHPPVSRARVSSKFSLGPLLRVSQRWHEHAGGRCPHPETRPGKELPPSSPRLPAELPSLWPHEWLTGGHVLQSAAKVYLGVPATRPSPPRGRLPLRRQRRDVYFCSGLFWRLIRLGQAHPGKCPLD